MTRSAWRDWLGLAVLSLPTLLLGLDVTALYLVVPSLAADLGPSEPQLLWIMDAYGFFIAGFLITMGTLGDRVGRRLLLMIGMIGFAAASVLAALAPSPAVLIIARALLGIAGATLMPSTLSLISNMFSDPRKRAFAIGVWATMFASGMALGPILGGLLVDTFWWGAPFLIALPVAAVVLALGPVFLPEYRGETAGRLDPASVALSLTGTIGLVYTIKHAAADGVTPSVMAALVIGLVSLLSFVRRQSRLADPLLDLTLFARISFTTALCVLLVGLVGVGGAMYLVTQYLQLVAGMSPVQAGLWMGPPALAMLVAALGAPVVARHVSPGLVMGATLTISLGGYVLLAVSGTTDTILVVAGFALVYLGLGAIAALGTDIVVGAAPPEKSGSAASLSETVQELGIAIGVAVLGTVTNWVHRSGVVAGDREAFTLGLNISGIIAGGAAAAATVACFVVLRKLPPIDGLDEAGAGATAEVTHGSTARR